jgi:hypothetical protein
MLQTTTANLAADVASAADPDRRDVRQSESAPEEARIARAASASCGPARQRQYAIRTNEGADSSVASAEAADDTSAARQMRPAKSKNTTYISRCR